MSNIAFLFLPLAFSSLPAVLPFVSPSSQVFLTKSDNIGSKSEIYMNQALFGEPEDKKNLD